MSLREISFLVWSAGYSKNVINAPIKSQIYHEFEIWNIMKEIHKKTLSLKHKNIKIANSWSHWGTTNKLNVCFKNGSISYRI